MVWQNKSLKNKFTGSVFCPSPPGFDATAPKPEAKAGNDCVYGLDEDILVCPDPQTGGRKWKDGRYGYGQVLLASGHLIVPGGGGVLALVKASPEKFEELARFQAIHGKTWSHPAIAHGKIFVRNAVEMACFKLSGKQTANRCVVCSLAAIGQKAIGVAQRSLVGQANDTVKICEASGRGVSEGHALGLRHVRLDCGKNRERLGPFK